MSVCPAPAGETRPVSTWSSCEVSRWKGGVITTDQDRVAEEVPVALVYNGISHAVMLATPDDLEDFALGFSLSEGILRDRSDLYDVEVQPLDNGIQVDLQIAAECFVRLKERRRNLTGRTGCGLCGVETLEQAVRRPSPVNSNLRVPSGAVSKAMDALAEQQSLNRLTGAVHAAGWAEADGTVRFVREDVGRHNAVDKLLGVVASEGVAHDSGFVVVTSRASYEIVQKAATRGIAMIAAISAPTGLAIRIADEAGVTLLGFTRGEGHVIYAHPERMIALNSGISE